MNLIYVPLNWRFVGKELQDVLNDCTPVLLITDEMNHSVVVHCIKEKVVLHSSIHPQTTQTEYTWQDNPQQPWLIIYTGGTTGKPKGVVLSFEAVIGMQLIRLLAGD